MSYALAKFILLAAVAFIAISDLSPVRHAAVFGMGDCAVRQIKSLPSTVDVIALGSSRIRSGIWPAAIEAGSGGELNRNFNLGRTGLSSMRSYITLRDAIENGVRPRFVVMEVNLDALQHTEGNGRVKLPLHLSIMRWMDIEVLLDLHADLSSYDLFRLRMLAAAGKLRGAIISVLSGSPVTWLIGSRESVTTCQNGSIDELQEKYGAEELSRLRQAKSEAKREITLAQESGLARREELFFIDRVRKICRTHAIGLLVVRPGAAYETALSPSALKTLQELIPEFVEPPPETVEAGWTGFLDATHMGSEARTRYSTWLASRLLEMKRL